MAIMGAPLEREATQRRKGAVATERRGTAAGEKKGTAIVRAPPERERRTESLKRWLEL